MPQDLIAKFLASKSAQTDLMSDLYAKQGMNYQKNLETVAAVKKAQGYSSTPESLSAARWYTGNGYYNVNKRTRTGEETLKDRQFQALTAAALPGMKRYDGMVYRVPTQRMENANKWWDKALPGQSLELGDQFHSFSASPSFAHAWAGEGDVIFRIDRPRAGAYIEPVSLHPGEHEVLLPPGLTYRVIGKGSETIDGRAHRVIDLEIVDSE